jgi:hypothetical protein
MEERIASLATFAERRKGGMFNPKKQRHPPDISPPSLRRAIVRLDESKLPIRLYCPHVTSMKLLNVLSIHNLSQGLNFLPRKGNTLLCQSPTPLLPTALIA